IRTLQWSGPSRLHRSPLRRWDSLATLRFCESVKQVRTKPALPVSHREDVVMELQDEVRRLELELLRARSGRAIVERQLGEAQASSAQSSFCMGLCPSRSRPGGAAEPLMAGAVNVGGCPSAASTSSGKGKVKSLKLCGPSKIQVLRGQLRGRKVALICCSEAHEDAIDITRKDGIVDKYEDWIQLAGADASGFNIANAWKSKVGVSLEKAKQWAEETLDEAEESEEDDSDSETESEEKDDLTPENKVEKDGAILVFNADGGKKKGKGSAYIFLRGTERHPRYALPPSCVAFEWGDLDEEARHFCRRRKDGQDMPVDELDALLERRKAQRRTEGLEIFDDWLVRHIESSNIPIEVVLEAPIPADEVELHIEEGVPSAPLAHQSLRRLELDSDSDSEDENDGGSDAYIDYLRRRLQSILPRERLHCMDPRELGEGSEDLDLRESFRRLRVDPLMKDAEEEELSKAAPRATQDSTRPPALPSFESFFGAAADLLYYHPEVKADYAPFLARCVKSPEKLRSFFDRLFFGTVQEACEELQLDEQTRPLARIRSLAYEESPGATLQRRPHERPPIAVKALPVDCYLKAGGSSPPRTWVSGLAERVARAGGEAFVSAAQAAYGIQVEQLLADPKNADEDGDYFEAWLREVFPDIYADVDSSDPAELRKLDFAPSEKRPNSKKHRHKLKDITIPSFADAFAELERFDPDERISTRRERVLAKILIDAFLLCIVDVAAVLRTAEAILKAPEESQLILVLYAGGTHIQHQVKFWQAQGFSSKALPNKGVLGQDDYEEFEPRGLDVPACLRDLAQLFPVP
ncbi:unc-104, partial [Symbiodinium sp. KB8]